MKEREEYTIMYVCKVYTMRILFSPGSTHFFGYVFAFCLVESIWKDWRGVWNGFGERSVGGQGASGRGGGAGAERQGGPKVAVIDPANCFSLLLKVVYRPRKGPGTPTKQGGSGQGRVHALAKPKHAPLYRRPNMCVQRLHRLYK